MQRKKAPPAPQRSRAASITSAAAAATVKMMEAEDEVLEMSGADLISKRLESWGIAHEEEEEEDTIVVDADKVPNQTNNFRVCYLLLAKKG
jgi:hypothetical protein